MNGGKLTEIHPNHDKSEAMVDEGLDESFPASDPPATDGITRIEEDTQKKGSSPDQKP
jgi:hypothetical protein